MSYQNQIGININTATDSEIIAMIHNDIHTFFGIPQSRHTPSICLAAAEKDPCSVIHMKLEHITSSVASAALKQNFAVYDYIPRQVLTPEFLLDVVRIEPDIMRNMPKKDQFAFIANKKNKMTPVSLCSSMRGSIYLELV